MILNKKLQKGFEKIEFEVENIDSLSIEIKGEDFFISLFIYDLDNKLVGQITTNKNVIRYFSKDYNKSSDGFSEISSNKYRLEYILYSNNEIDLIIDENESPIDRSHEINIEEDRVLSEEEKWYAGDFHTHSVYSDGKMTREENIEMAKSMGLSLFSPTEHNFNHNSFPKSDILIIEGTEITSSYGHINLFFTNESVFNKFSLEILNTEEGLFNILDYIKDEIYSINHAFMESYEFLVGDYKLEELKFIEIINDPTYTTSKDAMEKALKAWDIMLKNGYKVYGIGGSDSHLRPDEKYEGSKYPSLLGDPKTFIYANNLSKEEIKKSMLDGKITVSRDGLIEFFKVSENKFSLKLEKDSYHDKKLHIEYILDGKIYKKSENLNEEIELDLDDEYHYFRANIRDENGNLYGFTNPYFYNLEKADKKITTWKELMECVND